MTDPLPVRDAYARWAATYDLDRNATRDLDAAVLRATPLPLEGAAVVEFGAGTGKNTAYLAARARGLVALDQSAEMLALARRRVPAAHVRFVEHDIREPWPVAPGAADLVVGNLVLEHIEALAPVFGAAARALRPGGLLVVAELHPYRQWRGAGAKFVADEREWRVRTYVHTVAGYVNAGLAAGLALAALAEVGDLDGAATAPPRLLQLIFRR